MTRLCLRGDVCYVVTFPLHDALTYWRHALERGEKFINFGSAWVRTDDIYAIETGSLQKDKKTTPDPFNLG